MSPEADKDAEHAAGSAAADIAAACAAGQEAHLHLIPHTQSKAGLACVDVASGASRAWKRGCSTRSELLAAEEALVSSRHVCLSGIQALVNIQAHQR